MSGARERVASGHPLDAVFRARSAAIIGASANPAKLNSVPLQVLRTTGFAGAVYPVNPKYAEIDGIRCYAEVAGLPEAPDVALILVPAADVPGVLDECGTKGIRAAVVFSSGFEEVDASERLVEAVKATCERHRIALVGPNCEGVWSVRSKVLLTFGSAARRETLSHAQVAMLSQSGSMAGAVARQLQDSGFGCAYIVSVGNETVIGLLDYLAYIIDQDDVRVILLFLEGLKGGERLVRLAERARARGIVIVALKSGSSSAGRAAVASHTGKMTTAHAIYRDVFAQAGIIQVESLVELIEAAEVFSTVPLPAHRDRETGLAIFSIPGGTRALTADLCEARGVPLARFEDGTITSLEAILPAFGVASNPTDMTGQVLSQPNLFERALQIVAGDSSTTALLVQLANRGPSDAVRYLPVIAEAARARSLPTVLSFLGDVLPAAERLKFARHGVLCARDPADAVRYLDWLYRAERLAQRPAVVDTITPDGAAPRSRLAPLPEGWAASMQLLAEAGIAVPRWKILPAHLPAATMAHELRFPVAVKALPEQSEHKSERGLLRLNLATPDAVDQAARALRESLADPTASLLVQEMAPSGVETLISATADPDFGTIVAMGSGGVLVELLRDIAYLSVPITGRDVDRILERLAVAGLLAGFRGAPPADRRALVDAVLGLARAFVARSGELDEVEINPLIVLPDGQGVVAVDVLLKRKTGSGTTEYPSQVRIAAEA